MLYGTITEFCTEDRCPIMSAGIQYCSLQKIWNISQRYIKLIFLGPKYEYHWADGQTVKKPIKCSAPKYIDYLMTWVQDQLDDESLFPSKIGKCFCSCLCYYVNMLNILDEIIFQLIIAFNSSCITLSFRRPVSKKFHDDSKDYFKAALSSICTHLSSAFQVSTQLLQYTLPNLIPLDSCGNSQNAIVIKLVFLQGSCVAWRGGSSKHFFQTLHILCSGTHIKIQVLLKWYSSLHDLDESTKAGLQ